MYNLELERVSGEINKQKAKLVCVQLPDGLKPQAKDIVDSLERSTNAKILIWQGSCFGACDVPTQLDKLGVDLLVQWGHSELK